MPETILNVAIDERVKQEADAALVPYGLTASQLLSLIVKGMARDQHFALHIMKWASMFGPPPIIPNQETIEAIEAARRGETKPFNTVDELLADLNSDADD
jgi:DNA-damage-inducible protein J